MWKGLILILVGYALSSMFMNDRKKSGEDTKKEKEHLIATGEMVKAPVCGAYSVSDSNITVRDCKTIHRFCCYDGSDEFLKRIGKLPEKTGGDDDE